MPDAKISAQLTDSLNRPGPGPSSLVRVIVELEKPIAAGVVTSYEAAKQMFRDAAAPVEDAIRQNGGTVTNSAWINWTIDAQLPRPAIELIASLGGIKLIDLPNPLVLE